MERREIDAVRDRARATLTRLPGVVWVGFGIKEVDGQLTDDLALRVYVKEKRPEREIPEQELVPSEFEGIKTDVIRLQKSTAEVQEDKSRHSPLFSGITITNFKVDPAEPDEGVSLGTLGFFATMDGLDGKKNIFLISNAHVLGANGGVNGDTLFQPGFTEDDAVDLNNRGPIGEIQDVGATQAHSFQDDGDASPLDYYVDCGLAKINITISSWCESNCAQSYRNRLFDHDDSVRIEAPSRAVVGSTVFKSGRSTGKTIGTVIDCNGAIENEDGDVVTNVICVRPNGPETFFSESGDSGGPLLDDQNHLVGLHFGSNKAQVLQEIADGVPDPADPESHTAHIGAVLDFLGTRAGAALTPITSANPPIGPAGKTLSEAELELVRDQDETVFLLDRARKTEVGALEGFLAHRTEIVDLVNHCKPILVRWHRGKGPAFVSHLSESARIPGHAIPHEIARQARSTLLSDMADLLEKHGSEALRTYVATHRSEALELIARIDDLHTFVETLEREVVDG